MADTSKTNNNAQRVALAATHIHGMADASSWDPLGVGEAHWDPNPVNSWADCDTRFNSVSVKFDELYDQLNTRFTSIQNILANIRDGGTT